MNSEEKFRVISTKVSPFGYERLHRLAAKKNMKVYELAQMVLDTLIRYMDDRHNLSAEMELAMSLFEHMVGWKDALNLVDPSTTREVAEAIYILQDPEGEKKGYRCAMVRKPFMGIWDETENVQAILERVLEALLPELYWKLRDLAQDMGCPSLIQLIYTLVDAHTVEQMSEDIRKDFEDCNRTDFGQRVEYGQRTKRKHHKTPDMYNEQQTIHFSPDDEPDLPELGVDYQPFDQEF